MSMPRIDDWCWFGTCLTGYVTNHPNQHTFSPHCRQITSIVVAINEEQGWVQTQNTRYQLGKKARNTFHVPKIPD